VGVAFDQLKLHCPYQTILLVKPVFHNAEFFFVFDHKTKKYSATRAKFRLGAQ
jgi:hypothetical protein